MRSRRTYRRSRAIAMFAIGASVVCVFAQLSSAAHMAFVQHEYCAQHGLWSHSETHGHDSSHEEVGNEVEPFAIVHERSAFDHEHEHCHVLVERRDEWMKGSIDRCGVAPVLGDISVERVTTRSLDLSTAYLIAPKASPPPAV